MKKVDVLMIKIAWTITLALIAIYILIYDWIIQDKLGNGIVRVIFFVTIPIFFIAGWSPIIDYLNNKFDNKILKFLKRTIDRYLKP